jgi:hypothetical protein
MGHEEQRGKASVDELMAIAGRMAAARDRDPVRPRVGWVSGGMRPVQVVDVQPIVTRTAPRRQRPPPPSAGFQSARLRRLPQISA